MKPAAAGGGGAASFSDDFNRADNTSLGANWTEVSGTAEIAGNNWSPTSIDFDRVMDIYTGTACSTLSQYIKITLVSAGANSVLYPCVWLRYTDASSEVYALVFNEDEDTVEWRYFADGTTETYSVIGSPQAMTISDTGTFGVTITGTGTSTVLRIWVSPTGNAPTSASLWGGAAPTVTFTDDPGNPVDQGNYVGIGGFPASDDRFRMDNFFGGDVP